MKLNNEFIEFNKKYNLDQEQSLLYVLFKLNLINKDCSKLIVSNKSKIDYLILDNSTSGTKFPIFNNIEYKTYTPTSSSVIESRIDEYRNLFKGYKVGSMGDKKACIKKLEKWFEDYPSKSMDDVLNAVKYYVKSLNGVYTYIQRADYFIMKNGISTLSSIMPEIEGNNSTRANFSTFTKMR